MSRRKVINGKVYDVDTAKPVSLKGRTCLCRRIIKYENNSSSTSYIRLYRKKTGEYFTAKYSSDWPIDSFPYEITPRTEEWANGFLKKILDIVIPQSFKFVITERTFQLFCC